MTNYSQHMKLILISFSISTAAMFQFGYLLTYINSAQTAFTDYVNQSYHLSHGTYLNEDSFAWVWSIIVNGYYLGFLFGTIITPFAVEKLGRKWSLLASSSFDILGTALQVLAIPLQISYLLAAGRFVTAIGSGMSSGAITLYLQEISPTAVRGLVSSFQELSISLITLLGLVLGLPAILGNSSCIPYLIGIGVFPAFPKLILFWCPDTPKYLYHKKRNVDLAKHAILFYHGKNANVDLVLNEIRKETEFETDLDTDTDTDIPKSGQNSSVMQLVKQPYLRKAVFLGMLCFVAQNSCGMVPLVEFSTKILEDLNVNDNVALTAAVLIGVFNLISTTSSLFMVEKYGRKKILLSGFTGMTALQIVLMTCFFVAPHTSMTWPGYLATASIVGITCVFGLGPGTVPWFITSELVPQSVRSSASSVTQVFNICVMFTVNFTFLPLFYALQGYSFLILFIVPTILCIILLFFMLPETKSREISDIVLDLKKSSKSKKDRELEKPFC